MEKRIIKLPLGGDLEVDLTPKFLSILVDHFDLENVDEISDDHIRLFIYGSTRSAFDKSGVKLN